MKNNQAMIFLNQVVSLTRLSDEYCARTGMAPEDGLLWHITKVAVKIGSFECGDTVWQFDDLSLVRALREDPTNRELTAHIELEYMGRMPNGEVLEYAPTFYAGGLKDCGFFKDGKYVRPTR